MMRWLVLVTMIQLGKRRARALIGMLLLNILMERRILLKRMADRLVISAGRVLEIELLGALSVIEEDIVIAVYQHVILTFHWMKFRRYVLHAVVYAIVKFVYVVIIQ
jgi:hypothetical protein